MGGTLVAIEHSAALSGRLSVPRLRGWAFIAMLAILTGGSGLVARGVTESGWRLSGELVWRFNCFVYFAAVIAGPLARLIPWQRLRGASENRCQLIWGFCASFVVYLAGVCLPELWMPELFAPLDRGGWMAGIGTFDLFGAGLTVIIACAAGRHAALILGARVRGIILGVSLFCFWLAYVLTGLGHLSGPHRPDAFYGISLLLMIAALLLRFADHLAAKIRGDHNPA